MKSLHIIALSLCLNASIAHAHKPPTVDQAFLCLNFSGSLISSGSLLAGASLYNACRGRTHEIRKKSLYTFAAASTTVLVGLTVLTLPPCDIHKLK